MTEKKCCKVGEKAHFGHPVEKFVRALGDCDPGIKFNLDATSSYNNDKTTEKTYMIHVRDNSNNQIQIPRNIF